MISDRTFPTFQGDLRQGVEILLTEVGIPSKDYAFGNTKLFVREPQAVISTSPLVSSLLTREQLYSMEDARLKAFDKIAQKVKTFKCTPKITQGNVVLQYLRLLIFEELNEFTVYRDPKKGGTRYSILLTFATFYPVYLSSLPRLTPKK